MKREFIIYIDQTYDWEIRLKGLRDYNPFNSFDTKCKFAIFKRIDNQIVYLYDTKLDISDIDLATNEDIYQELCSFRDEIISKKFDGIFIDALNYIKTFLCRVEN